MICPLKFSKIKYQKAKNFINKFGLSVLTDKFFFIVISHSILLLVAMRHLCFF